jgi:hypothetical protein
VLDVEVAYPHWWAESGPNSLALRLVEDGPVAGERGSDEAGRFGLLTLEFFCMPCDSLNYGLS